MQRPLEDGSDLDRLKAEVRDLERRLSLLESQRSLSEPDLAPAAVSPAAADAGSGYLTQDLASVAGRAILGLAGAYLLRALAESGAVPRLAVVIAAIAYACMWVWFASHERPFGKTAPFVYAATAALILSPLLWESTVRFGLLPNVVTAALLAGLPAFSALLGVAGWPAVLASSATALALMVRTGDVMPFVIALLLIAVFFELKGNPTLRALAALAAIASLFVLVRISAQPGDSYQPVPALVVAICSCALPFIFAAGMAYRRAITVPELCLFGSALVVTVYGTPAWVSGAILLAACSVCVWLSTRFPALEICALPAALASVWLLAPPWAALCIWAVAAVLVTRTASGRDSRSLAFHGVALLAAASLPGAWLPPVFLVPLAVCAAAAWWWSARFLWPRLFFGALSIAATGILLSAASGAGPHLLPTVQTLYLCLTALSLGYASARVFQGETRPELRWLGFGLLAAAGLKLLLVDFRNSPPAMLAIALVCFGIAVILVPRLSRTA